MLHFLPTASPFGFDKEQLLASSDWRSPSRQRRERCIPDACLPIADWRFLKNDRTIHSELLDIARPGNRVRDIVILTSPPVSSYLVSKN